MKPKYEYVMSGMSYAIIKHESFETDEQKTEYRRLLKCLDDKMSMPAAFLYNGYTENRIGKNLRKIFGQGPRLYVDSGGLQMITLGKTCNDKAKDNIYETQARWGNLAMSFDEIPIKVTSKCGRSLRGETNNRYVDIENFDSYAIKSGINLNNQIQYFKTHKHAIKPFLIVQGTSLETYQRWADLLLDQIPESDYNYIGGVAIATAALGTGLQQDFVRAYITVNLKLPGDMKKHIHLLGIGSIKRLSPFLCLSANGEFQDSVISYDSTTHTSCLSLANYQLGTDLVSCRGSYHKTLDIVLDDIEYKLKTMFNITDITREQICDCLLKGAQFIYDKYNNDLFMFQRLKFIILFCNIYNFNEIVENSINDFDKFLMDSKYGDMATIFNDFKNVKDDKQLSEWIHINRNKIPTKSVPFPPSSYSLEDFL